MKLTLNSAIKGISGNMDNWVYRQVGSETIVAGKPDPRPDNPSAKQLAQRKRFLHAREYAMAILRDSRKRAVYVALAKAAGRQPDKLLTSDFLTPPEITSVDVTEYHGRVGEPIYVLAQDDIEVVSVDVALQTEAGAPLEAGPAMKDHGVWVYRATAAAPEGQRILVTVTAKDRPGNATTAQVRA